MVLNEMDLKVVMMGQPGSVEVHKFPHALISIYLVLAFTPFVTFLIVNVAAEKEHRLKDIMTMMGLYDTAFCTVGSMLTVVFGCMSLFTVLMRDFPQPLVWLLCLLSPSAFSIGIAQGDGAVFSSLTNGPHPLYVPLVMLILDCILYLLLAIYLDQVLPGLTFDIYEGQITALLGHSGAGKSTLMNILCGICPPTNGSATIYGSPVAEIAEGSEMKQLVGICPQFNIIFDVLTVEEHLRIFAAIKGIPPADINAEAGRVIVLSTHYMDEADILAAVISQGHLKCVGSSLYLKIKCGVGYHLRMSISEGCDAEKVASLMKQYVPKAKLSQQNKAELTFTLPFESVNTVFNQEQAEDECDNASLDDTDQRLLTFSDSKSDVVSGHTLWRQQFSAVAWLHMLNMRREWKAFVYTFSVAFNSTNVHSLPMVVNILSNALLRGLNGTGQIRTWTKPFDYVLCTVGFGPAMILFTYVVSFGFTRVQSNRDFFSFISMMVCVVSASIVQLSLVNDNPELTRTLHNALCLFNPLYPLMGCLNCITKVGVESNMAPVLC
ncbi:hypothetical protein GOODEAATRI_006081 [Goodea atripinnis]|uniref:ABC transporter domain-containing protein n=1 Tax=Goodea atripinnis TaxID=208336 RepID=A0ABV0NS77_9TELE